MKFLKLASLSVAGALLLPSITSCSNDPSPFNWTISNEKNKATIQLRLNVEETRAGELSTSEEDEIKNVTIYVFNENQELEPSESINVVSVDNTVSLEVSPGYKTLYIVSAKSIVNPSKGTKLSDFENMTFTSTLENIKTENGFVMIGKSEPQQVMISASADELPSSNIFNVTLERVVAKAQVKISVSDNSSEDTSNDFSFSTPFGINFGDASFKAIQLNKTMIVKHNGTDVSTSYNNYSLRDNDKDAYLVAVTTDFTVDGCEYMSENIVSQPVSGNTTFLSIRFATTPANYYTFDSTNSTIKTTSEKPAASTTYYTVGIQDTENGIVDYALDSSTKHIITFKDETDAKNYVMSLNKGASSAMTVSQSETPLKVASKTDQIANARQFEVIPFEDGYVYYRVNIAHQETSGNKYKVVRNKFYKVSVNSVNSLGFSSEALLRPTNPEVVLDANGHSWISATVSVAPWEEVPQDVDL